MDALPEALWWYSIRAMRTTSLTGWVLTLPVLAGLLGGAAYEAALALGVTEVGPLPGEMPPGEPLVLLAYGALLAGGLLFLLAACTRMASDALATPLLPWIAAAAVCFAVARYYSYDAYAAPGLVRISEVSTFSGWWIFLLALGGAGAALVAWRAPRAGLAVVGAFLWVVAIVLFLIGPWH